MKKITIIVEKTETGYSAYSENHPVFTVGKNLDELKFNILEALDLYFEDSQKKITIDDLEIAFNP